MHLRLAASWCLDKSKTLLAEVLIVRKLFMADWQMSTWGIKFFPKSTLPRSIQMVHGSVFNRCAFKNLTQGNVTAK